MARAETLKEAILLGSSASLGEQYATAIQEMTANRKKLKRDTVRYRLTYKVLKGLEQDLGYGGPGRTNMACDNTVKYYRSKFGGKRVFLVEKGLVSYIFIEREEALEALQAAARAEDREALAA